MKQSEVFNITRNRLLEKVETKNSWGKNEVKELIKETFFEIASERLKTIEEEQEKANSDVGFK